MREILSKCVAAARFFALTRAVLCFLAIIFWSPLFSQSESLIDHTLFLIGDCGEPYVEGDPIAGVFHNQIRSSGANTTVLFLGDNVYVKGLPERGHRLREDGEDALNNQAGWIKGTEAQGIFIPGNHDWAHWGKKGYKYIINQQNFIDSIHNQVTLLPRNGCPGPVVKQLGDHVTLVIIDTQWLLHRWEKPGAESGCFSKNNDQFFDNLQQVFNENKGKRIVVAGHHPLITYGEHGGVFRLRAHLFPLTELSMGLYIPLPIIGSLYPLYRKFYGSIQDTPHPKYKKFVRQMEAIMKDVPGSVYIAGHEHALQHIVKNQNHFIVSGSGSKIEFVKKKKFAKYASHERGFVRMTVKKNSEVILHYFQVDTENPQGKEVYQVQL
jgi:hypothetical protein